MSVLNDRSRTSCELAMNCGPDSPHVCGTSRSLSVYTSKSNEPEINKIKTYLHQVSETVFLKNVEAWKNKLKI